MKVLLFGKSGQVGWELQRSLAPLGEIVALDADSSELCGDFTNPEEISATIRAVSPDVIVNAAAHTAVDKAESEPDLVRTINALSPGILAREAKSANALLVHYSTDYVFDGSGTRPWVETDAPAPLNVYGATKLEGEKLIQQSGCKHLIFRTSWVYGARGGNFARTMLKLAQEREALKVIDDQFGAPTGADLLADLTAHMLRAARADASLSGTYHAVAGGETSWHGYASHVIAWARAAGLPLRVTEGGIQAVPSSEFPLPARRPLNSRLSTARLRERFGLALPDWRAGVERMLAEVLGR